MATAASQSQSWSEEVVQYAREKQVEQYLQSLSVAMRELFPTAQINVSIHVDPELRDENWLMFEVEAPMSDVPDYVRAHDAWCKKLFEVCPAPLVHHFGLDLTRR